PRQNRSFTRLVVVEPAQEYGEAHLNRTIQEIRLGESEAHVASSGSDLRRQAQRFAESQEVVRRIRESQEASRDSADAAAHLHGILAALFHFERDVDRIGSRVALDIRRFVLLQRFEIAELIQSEDRELPEARVEDIAFVDEQLASDNFIAGGRVAREIDTPNEELLAFVKCQCQIDAIR